MANKPNNSSNAKSYEFNLKEWFFDKFLVSFIAAALVAILSIWITVTINNSYSNKEKQHAVQQIVGELESIKTGAVKINELAKENGQEYKPLIHTKILYRNSFSQYYTILIDFLDEDELKVVQNVYGDAERLDTVMNVAIQTTANMQADNVLAVDQVQGALENYWKMVGSDNFKNEIDKLDPIITKLIEKTK